MGQYGVAEAIGEDAATCTVLDEILVDRFPEMRIAAMSVAQVSLFVPTDGEVHTHDHGRAGLVKPRPHHTDGQEQVRVFFAGDEGFIEPAAFPDGTSSK